MEKFDVICKKGHTWKTCVSYIRSGFWCPYCKTYKNENEFRDMIEQFMGYSFKKCRPSWLRLGTYRLLELDGYNAQKKIAFEYQGKQHYQVGKFFKHTEEYFLKLQERDRIKKELCEKRGVKLIVVPYYHPKSKWTDLIGKSLK